MTAFPKSFTGRGEKLLGDIPPASPLPSDCENCAGRGFMTAFKVSSGSHVNMPTLADNAVLKSVDDPTYGWVWYTGVSVADTCPVCRGTGKKR